MPSPLGHALLGLAAGWSICPGRPAPPASGRPPDARSLRELAVSPRAWLYVAAALAADLDLLVGLHSRQTHSVGAVVLAGAATLWVARRKRREALLLSLGVTASYASHVLLDWLSRDTSPPIGIMALWPFSDGFYTSPISVFAGISRRYWLATAWAQNLESVALELLILAPIAWTAWKVRSSRGTSSAAE